MASAIAVDGAEGSAAASTDAGLDPLNEVLRDITRCGLAIGALALG